jgi:hypothetical protein
MKTLLVILPLAACATTQPSAQQTAAELAAKGQVKVVTVEPKLVCEWVQETGSNVRRKVCRPEDQEDLDLENEVSAADLRLMQERTSRVPAPSPGRR